MKRVGRNVVPVTDWPLIGKQDPDALEEGVKSLAQTWSVI